MIVRIALLTLLFVGPAAAQEHDLRDTDRILDGQKIGQDFTGRSVNIGSSALDVLDQRRVRYIYSDGKKLNGTYTLDAEGLFCITYDNGTAERCHYFVMDPSDQLVMVTDWKHRFPVTLGAIE